VYTEDRHLTAETVASFAQPAEVYMKPRVFGGLAVFAFVVGLYCFAGYAMNASFSVTASGDRNARAAVIWGGAGIGSMIVSFMLVIAAWKRS
jgi:hypothetical protein